MNTTSASSARSASATASAGTTCPAVPPAPITIRVALTRPGGVPDDLQAPRAWPRDVQQNPDRGQQHAQIGRRVGDERQRDPGQRRDPEHDEDVEDALAKD